jgi:hypothetical protein
MRTHRAREPMGEEMDYSVAEGGGAEEDRTMTVDKRMHIVCGMKMGKNRINIKWDGRICMP